MRTETILIAVIVGTLLGKLTVPISPFTSAQPTESSAHRVGGEAARPIVLEVPAIVGSDIYNTCGDAWDDNWGPAILRH